ncbi:MAG: hypothetical protein OJJ54_22560 [Pseudonocardia sp.]|nr:hypothetical protein [Pseudonocardia sp.]
MAKVKRKCCRSKPKRCKSCPVVALRLSKIDTKDLGGKALARAIKNARVY